MRCWTALRLWADWCWSKERRAFAGYLLAERATRWLHPHYCFSEYGRSWLHDADFLTWYRNFPGCDNDHSADRKYFLRSLVALTRHLPGDTAECGVYQGASSFLICEQLNSADRRHHIFDSFAGLSNPGPEDGLHWQPGQFAVPELAVRKNLQQFAHVDYHAGWIPATLSRVADKQFCFVHLDVDLYEPTRDASTFFYSRLTPGGILLCDDYGFSTCPGAQQAMNELAAHIGEPLIRVPTGQAFIIKSDRPKR
ncbi:MAG: class I SAM-dependent methyltransferase [Planctomycetota bacterium]|nr:class I SAM-dependent methyltransferase [Planctomycetota bacterium]MDA1179284.1 class I SAM-dependent methyltransferase [Planctomycetota bacterium]